MYFGKKLLLMTALALSVAGASAEIVDGVRQKPVPTKSPLVNDQAMYLYNVGTKMFFRGANDWNTRASVAEKGYKVYIVDNGDGSVLLKDSVETQKAIKCTFADADGNAWVDNNDAPNRFWKLTKLDGDIYRISVSELNPEHNAPDTFFGPLVGEPNNTRLFWNRGLDEVHADWYFVTVKDNEAYIALYDAYDAAKALKALIDEAEAKGVKVDAQKAVYLDESKTVEEINAACDAIKAAIAAAEESSVTADKPSDKTSLITNPSYANGDNTGWSGDAPAFGFTAGEFYEKKFDTHQTITNAPKGVYAVSVQAFYRSGFSDAAYTNYKNMTGYDAKLYAVNGTDSVKADIVNPFSEALTEAMGMNESNVEDGGVTYYIPNNMETAEAYFVEKGLYNNKVFFASEDGEMTIGMSKANGNTPGGNWVLFDNWGLTYYGNGADAYTLWLNEAKKAAKDYSALPEGTLVTAGMVDAYNTTIAGITSATNKKEVLDAIAKINEAVAAVDANIDAWKAYQEAITRGAAVANDESISGDDKDNLADYIDMESQEIVAALALTTEEINAETEKVNAMTDAAVKNGIAPNTDVTEKYLVNADFGTDNKGWKVDKKDGGNVNYGGSKENRCFEAWNNAEFDVYQEVKDAPRGVYEISVQGFYRYKRGSAAYEAYQAGTAAKDVVDIYVNNRNAHFKSVFDEKVANGEMYDGTSTDNPPYVDPNEEFWYPNNMADASRAFADGRYVATSFGVVANPGDVLRIGVKGNTSQEGDSWAIWDNFKMVFKGTDAEAVKAVLPDVINDLKTTRDEGKTVGQTVGKDADAALAAAQAAIDGTDGDAMFKALCDALDANTALQESAKLFASLTTKAEELNAAYLESKASEAVKTEAANLYTSVTEGMASMEDEDVAEMMDKIEAMLVKLAIPADADKASDENPVDLTSLIKTPSFDNGEGGNSIEGWDGTDGKNFGNDDTQKAALAVEFYDKTFDLHQTIVGLPAGTYKVSVNAFCRMGGTNDDYAMSKEGKQSTATVYASTASVKETAVVSLLAAGATEDQGIAGASKIADTELFVPNDMVSAVAYFGNGAYLTDVFVKVEEGEALTIGITHEKDAEANRADWVIMDNWTLTYYGKDSAHTGVDSVEAGAPAKVEFFNVNGMKTQGLSRGVNIIRMTDAEGNVTVKKVNVK